MKMLCCTVARWAFAQLRLIHQLQPYPSRSDLTPVTHALVTSRLDYCNALLCGAASEDNPENPTSTECSGSWLLGSNGSTRLDRFFSDYTGCPFASGQNSKCWSWCLKPSTAWVQRIWGTACVHTIWPVSYGHLVGLCWQRHHQDKWEVWQLGAGPFRWLHSNSGTPLGSKNCSLLV